MNSEVFSSLRGFLGILVLLGCCWLLSRSRKHIQWRTVIWGVALQLLFAFLVLKVEIVRDGFEAVSSFFVLILEFSRKASEFLFGSLVKDTESFGFIFAFQVLPTIVFFASLSSVLYYLGILQRIVYLFAWVMRRTMRLSGPESLAAAANIFIGQTEAPLLIRPYLKRMTRSELFCLMTGGMATIAGGVLAAYVGFLGGTDPTQQLFFATHLLAASVISAPAAVVTAKLLYPETEDVSTRELHIPRAEAGTNLLESIARGAYDGLKLAVNVGVMLLVFIAIVEMANYALTNLIGAPLHLNEWVKNFTNGRYEAFSLQFVVGLLFSPIAWLIGTPTHDIFLVEQLIGEKTVLNEFYAYVSLGNLKASGLLADPKSIIIATYALCGFSNFSSIGIQIGGIGALIPERRAELASMGFMAMIAGTIACLLTACVAAIVT